MREEQYEVDEQPELEVQQEPHDQPSALRLIIYALLFNGAAFAALIGAGILG
jgi:hypothetical protein